MSAALAAGVQRAGAQPSTKIGSVGYVKLGTRGETEARFLAEAAGMGGVRWGEWHLLTPFAGREKGALGTVLAPEDELAKMGAGGPGPDLAKEYEGKNGVRARWRTLSEKDGSDNQTIDLMVNGSKALDEQAMCYLYRTITVEKAVTLPVEMGSDDGLRFWLNGKLLVDADVPRGLDPSDHHVMLELKAGVNHVLCKVSQGGGVWQYQINNRVPLDSMTDALLQYRLNADFPTAEQRYYRVTTIPVPGAVTLEVGGLDVAPDGRAVVSTRRGDVYIVGSYAPADHGPVTGATWTLFASGLHEALGLAVREEKEAGAKAGWVVYCAQRPELTRLVDVDGDDRADRYETVCDSWGLSGNYHEFAFGPRFDRDGTAIVTLNVGFCGGLGKAVVPWRGWSVRIDTKTGALTPICDGLRSPNGIGVWTDGALFYCDNQGDFVGTNKITLMRPGFFEGHPAGLRWRTGWTEGGPQPERQRPAVWLPYKKMGQSTADFLVDATGGKFGPFGGQVFVGDQTNASVMRVDLEKIGDGDTAVYQGACFPFFSGLDCGVNRVCFAKDGSMLIGQTDRGWSSVGRRRFGLQRLEWLGPTPFEVLTMRAASDGFVLTFTRDVDQASAADPKSYSMSSYSYEYHPEYGSPEIDTATPVITRAEVRGARQVKLTVQGLRAGGEGYVHELHLAGVKDKGGEGLLHPEAYYTLQRLPGGEPVVH